MAYLGACHIAGRTDHLLFLLVLMIAAPLAASSGRWRGRRRAGTSLISIGAIVAAFAIGHALALALGTALSTDVAETLIAVALLAAAIHAVRPLFPGREAVVAGAFGVVHGLASGFRLEIEPMHLVVLSLSLPLLLVLARHRAYIAIRYAGAAFAGTAAISWIGECTALAATPIPFAVERIASRAPWILGGLAVIAIAIELNSYRCRARPVPGNRTSP